MIAELINGFIAEAIHRGVKPSSVYVDTITYNTLAKELFWANPALLERHQIEDLNIQGIPVFADRSKETDCLYIEIA